MFVHENPAHAIPWAPPCFRRLTREDVVDVVEADQYMFGLETWGRNRAQLVLAKKPTIFMSNSRPIGSELKRRGDGGHEYQPLVHGRAKDAAHYPPVLCRAIICWGVAKEKMQRQFWDTGGDGGGQGTPPKTNRYCIVP